MARRQRLDLMISGIPQTGNGNAFDWPGGDGVMLCESATGGTVGLQIQGPGGAWVPLNQRGTNTQIDLAGGSSANFAAPAGPIRAAAGVATGAICCVIGTPANGAG